MTKKLKIGLALGSGVARGYAHIGAIRALEEHGIKPDIVCGTSIGALVGASYVAGKLDVLEDWACSLDRKQILSYLDLRFMNSGLISGRKLFRLLDHHLGGLETSELKTPFVAVAADLGTGHEVWLRTGSLSKVIKASFALPGVFSPVRMNRHFLVDGALVNPVPVSVCRALGAHLTIAIDLNGDMLGKANRHGKNFQTILGYDPDVDIQGATKKASFLGRINPLQFLFKRKPDEPSFFGVMVSSLNIIQDRLTRSRLAGDPPDVHIKPSVGHIGMLEYEKRDELMKAGYDAVKEMIPQIESALEILGH